MLSRTPVIMINSQLADVVVLSIANHYILIFTVKVYKSDVENFKKY